MWQLIMGSKEKCKQIASRLSRVRLKKNLDVDAPAITAGCMNHLEEKSDKPVWERLHLFILYVVCYWTPHKSVWPMAFPYSRFRIHRDVKFCRRIRLKKY
jgi:hypothetical protein